VEYLIVVTTFAIIIVLVVSALVDLAWGWLT